jgi:hypothetical protein
MVRCHEVGDPICLVMTARRADRLEAWRIHTEQISACKQNDYTVDPELLF